MPLLDWFVPDNNTISDMVIRDGRNTIVLDIKETNGNGYTVTLNAINQHNCCVEYRGTYRRSDNYEGQCSCTIYFCDNEKEESFFLRGKWNEEGSETVWILDNTY